MNVAKFYINNLPFKQNADDKKEKLIVPSWERAHKFADEFLKWAEVYDGLAKDKAIAFQKMVDAGHEAFRSAPTVDCSYGDSPIARQKMIYFAKAYLKKLGWPGISGIMTPAVDIEPIFQVAKKNIQWLFKLENEKAD